MIMSALRARYIILSHKIHNSISTAISIKLAIEFCEGLFFDLNQKASIFDLNQMRVQFILSCTRRRFSLVARRRLRVSCLIPR